MGGGLRGLRVRGFGLLGEGWSVGFFGVEETSLYV